jgi:signal transduction histidine kinase
MILRFLISGAFVLVALSYIIVFLVSWRRGDFYQAGKMVLTTGIVWLPAVLLCWAVIYLNVTLFLPTNLIASFLSAIFLVIALGALSLVVWLNASKLISLLFFYGVYDSNQILREYSHGISSVTNAEQLAQVSLGLICQALKVQHGFLFEVSSEQEADDLLYRLVGVGSIGKGKPVDLILDSESLLLKYYKKTDLPQTRKDQDRILDKLSLSSDEHRWLQDLYGEIFVPIHSREEWIGLIVLGSKKSDHPYHPEELTLLITLADQLSLAIKNARLVESLMRVNHDFRRAYQAMEQSNQHFQQALSQLQKIDQTKSDFISIASHELLTPVTIIRGYTEILLDDPNTAENDYQVKMLNGIHIGIMRLNEIIETMLDMASIDARSLSLHKVDVSVGYLIQSLTKSLKLTLAQRNLSLTVDGLSDLPVIRADQEALRKVFNHLILNAVQKTPNDGKINITGLPISQGQADCPDGGIEIIISDTGIGIKREHLDLIFTKFYQASSLQHHSSGKSSFKGSGPGLGLAVAKGIVEAHGGKIWAESPGYDEEKCPGSQYHVVLPC